ncbi:hypothetical protein GTA08_BOTSDO14207 [Botryosphaeria dothidea]|uniref:Uncharacterized protein n=1 Tax=Botryosphaeria dothidea TaxID=55169 RepID=A0A8H4INL6_9PEZI|nr:hypothetical protein GTA08_BOTSDO14207 [Botryosphaeria dothidea]
MDTAVEEPPTPEKAEKPWSVKVTLVPRRKDSANFHLTVDKAFSHVLKGRPWVLLIGYRAHNDYFGRIALRQLPPEISSGDLWDYFFLDHHCIAHGQDARRYPIHRTSRFRFVVGKRFKELPAVFRLQRLCRLDRADLIYEYSPSPPPYTSQRNTLQTQPDAPADNRLATPLGVLATAASASVLGHALNRHPTSQSATAQSLRSLVARRTDQTMSTHTETRSASSAEEIRARDAYQPQSLEQRRFVASSADCYYSGKKQERKMTVREKTKEPLQFKLQNLLHHRNKEDAA